LSSNLVWLVALIGAYWAFCIDWGVTAGRLSSTAGDFHLADRRLPPWIFVVTATGISFSGWTFFGQPALIFRDGFPFAEISLGAVAIALTGVVFTKRQWLLGKRFGYITPGDMFADYFDSEMLPMLVLLVALVFAIPFVSMQLSAAGFLIANLSGGAVEPSFCMWVMTAVVFLYACLGGIRGAAYVGVLQGVLLVAGMIALGLFAYIKMGGMDAFGGALAHLGASHAGPLGDSTKDYNGYFDVSGVVQFTAGLGRETPVGSIWTTSMILTYGFALMGIQAAPAFTMWGFSSRTPKGFAAQQVWASAGVVGAVLVIFAVIEGMGAHFLGGSGVSGHAGTSLSSWLSRVESNNTDTVTVSYINAIGKQAPWFGALIAVCAIAAVQVVAAAFATTTGSMLAHDLYRPYFNPKASDRQERLAARIGIGLVLLTALVVATYFPSAESELGALALAFGFQLWPALAGICWLPWVSRQGATLGLIAGLVAVVLTEPFGHSLAGFFGFTLPWGRWPWTVYSAGWGIAANVTVCSIVSLLTRKSVDRERRLTFHRFLAGMTRLAPEKQALKPVAWAITLGWLFFALGPGAVFGNSLFGSPTGGLSVWVLGVPSLWAWQLIWWALGIMMVWFLAYKMEMSTVIGRSVEFGVPVRSYFRSVSDANKWRQWLLGIVLFGALATALHWLFS